MREEEVVMKMWIGLGLALGLAGVMVERADGMATQDVAVAATGAVAVAESVTNAAAAEFPVLPKPGRKVPLDEGHYFIYGLAESPKLGTVSMRVEIFTTEGVRDTSFVIKGDVDMPSMRGAHSSGEKDFVLSNKGVYLMPVRLVMPGEWEVRFTFSKDGKVVRRGVYLFSL
jgi:hypothetical protein